MFNDKVFLALAFKKIDKKNIKFRRIKLSQRKQFKMEKKNRSEAERKKVKVRNERLDCEVI